MHKGDQKNEKYKQRNFFRFNTSSQRFNYWKSMADSKASRDLDRVGEIEFASFVRE